ncbi:MAG TPA: CotH kinase family protein [Tepidisphaeraceae bacterium]|jgi:hypothetical protein|nr:CotH kinase family protein [Tepidisphaeraceae bacterium]
MKIRRPHRARHRSFALAEALESRRLFAADLVISEFMASNSKTLKDAAGDYADWIEIHNAGDASANLNDYFLTDSAGNPEEWRFPVQSLAAGSYLVVFADGTDTAPVANTELHTNFKLSADGEYLALTNAADDSVQFAYSPQFPAQTADISYGLSDANNPNSAEVFFNIPTPGAANNPSAAIPVFSVQGQVFTGTLTVSLTDSTPGAVIHYTTNGTTPTASSPTYTGAFSLTASTPIRVLATASGLTSSPVTSQTYERVDSTVTSVQNSNLPIIIIDTYGATMGDTTGVAGSATVMNSTTGANTNLFGTADYQGRIGIHIRGSTSESYPKQQYAIELWDENNDDKKASLLGMPADSDWVLYAPYTELSLMNNPLAYQWANQLGEYASGTQFVEVYMSTGGNSYVSNTTTINYSTNYLGVYILEEKIKADSSRVDVGDEISATNTGGGYIVAQDRYTGNDYFTTPQGVHMVLDDPDSASLESTIGSNWDQFENALFSSGTGWETPGNANYYGNYINIQSFADFYLVNELSRNIDAFWLSTYYNKAADTVVNGVTTRGLISAGPVWDFNLGFGEPNYNQGANADGWDTTLLSPSGPGVSGFNPQDAYFQRLLTDPNFVQAVSDRWNQLRQGVLSNSSIVSDINANIALLSDNTGVYPTGINPTGTTSPIMRNFQKWPELGAAVVDDSDYDPAGSWLQDVDLMQNWLIARANWMDSQFAPQSAVTAGGDFGSPVTVSMTPVDAASNTDVQLVGPNSTAYYKVPTATIANWQTLSATSQPSGWSTSTSTSFGYDTTTTPVNFAPYISTNVQSLMYNLHPDLYVLMNFTVSDPSSIQALILKIRYDDDFTVWINGVRLMDADATGNSTPAYNSLARATGDDTQAILYREFDLTAIKNLLHTGNNTLAVQGMNIKSSDSDFLLAPTLYARTYNYAHAGSVYYTTDGSDPRTTTGSISSSALLYNGAFSLSTNTEIKARTYNNGVWGAISDQVYDFSATALRITELMFDPPAGAGFSQQDFEYVEVQNVSSSPLNLSGYQFSNGVTFSFPNVTLAAGAYGVVVKNPAAFAARYGSSPNVLGTYTGSFDNSGETVAIQDGFGNTVETFKYDPTWYPGATGQGYSLVVANPTGDTATLSTAAGWRASFAPDGAPGIADSDSITPAVTSWNYTENGATGQPTLRLNFSSSVSAGSPANISIVNTITGANITPLSHSFDGSTITFTFASSLPSGDYLFTLPAAGVFNISDTTASANQTLNLLLVRSGQTYALPPLSSGLVIQQLALGAASSLDIGTNTVVINSSAVTPDSIRQLLASGYAAGAWNGTGILTSASAGNHSIADAVASDIGMTTFNSQPINPSAIVLKYTLAGDANMDGRINSDDYALTDRGLAKGLTNWISGDFNYDAVINSTDLAILDGTYTVPTPPAPLITTAPLEVSTPADPVTPVVIATPPVTPVVVTTPPSTTPTSTKKTPAPTKKKKATPTPKPVKKVAPKPKPTPKKTTPVVKKAQSKAKSVAPVPHPALHAKIFSAIAIHAESIELALLGRL